MTVINPKTGEPWVAEFDGQREPFQPGNQLAVTHGAYSSKRTDPIARRLIEEVASDPATAYLAAPSYHATLWNWAVAQARVELMDEHIATLTMEQATRSDRGQVSPYEQQRKFMSTALNIAKDLGLTPKSRAAMGKDIAATQMDVASLLTQRRSEAERNARHE
jgi:hypothetical protein